MPESAAHTHSGLHALLYLLTQIETNILNDESSPCDGNINVK